MNNKPKFIITNPPENSIHFKNGDVFEVHSIHYGTQKVQVSSNWGNQSIPFDYGEIEYCNDVEDFLVEALEEMIEASLEPLLPWQVFDANWFISKIKDTLKKAIELKENKSNKF